MFKSQRILWSLVLLSCPVFLFAQTTAELFSTPGIVFGAYDIDDTFIETDRGYSFIGVNSTCNDEVFMYREIDIPFPHFLKVEGEKVYEYQFQCVKQLLYDFSLEIGAIVESGFYAGYEVIDRYQYELLNGEFRLALDLSIPGTFSTATWINGIGDERQGLFPIPDFPFSARLLACVKVEEELLLFAGDDERCAHYTCIDPKLFFNVAQEELTIQIENLSDNVDNYLWDFGDGNTSTEVAPTHEYAVGGCYTISLTAGNDCYGEESREILEQVCISDAWQEIQSTDTLGNFVEVLRASDELVFLFKNGILYRSTDQAITWLKSTLPALVSPTRRSIQDIKMFDAERGILVATHVNATDETEGLFITTDGGTNWEEISTGFPNLEFCSVLSNGQAWAVTGGDELLFSEDFGNSWNVTLNVSQLTVSKIWSFEPGVLIAQGELAAPNFDDVIATSTDNGFSWTTIQLSNEIRRVQFVNNDVAFGYGFSQSGFHKTTDQGLTWTEIDSTVWPRTIHFMDTNSGWVADGQGQVNFTEDGGQSFQSGSCRIYPIYSIAGVGPRKAVGIRGTRIMHFDLDRVSSCLSPDNDMDGFADDIDCDDENAAINPDATEIPYNGWDDDCDSLTLDDDLDQDGFLMIADCDDNNAEINPDAQEIPNNGIDEDCDGEDLMTATSNLEAAKIEIFPNPTDDKLSIRMNNAAAVNLYLTNSNGQLLLTKRFVQRVDLELSNFPEGVYFLVLKNGNAVFTEKIVRLN